MGETERSLESSANACHVHDVYEFLAGAAAVGVCLGSLVQYAGGETPAIPKFLPIWAWLSSAAFFLVSALRAKSARARVADASMAILLLSGAAVARLPESPIVLVGQSLCLGAWGVVAVQQSGGRMPGSLARAGLALAIATTSSGFLPGLWKWASLAAVVIVVLVAIWILDNQEADGVIIGRKKHRAAQQGDEADER
jgi:hypothetical protein